MKLEKLFKKKVDRPIEGVIKADDEASLKLELEEYVITSEVSKRLEAFLEAYINYTGANGVWISGFFGSGKSHLLKMLALLLENKLDGNISPLEIFLDKEPLIEDSIFAGNLKKTIAIPSQSILFNIDQKADVISKAEIDALIAVFVKVFDEHCGYYGKQAYIAQFERELDEDNSLKEFIEIFEKNSGKSWVKGRARKRLYRYVDEAYSQVTNQNVTEILDKYRADYKLSIEDFAIQINEYIAKQEKGFRLNFFVDEVGQYIAGNTKLMTNLQTVAESLATKCNGNAWVIVTAQEDMSSVIGVDGKQNSNDFSKIQARFQNRMKLTSQNVSEVIQHRLLEKKKEYYPDLIALYDKQKNNFKTLFDFADGAQTYRNFKDENHFIQSYPFAPYQYTLFQAAIKNLSTHGAFEGKHSSVGERSMLGVFQQVAIAIKDHQLGELATFDLMFEGVRTALKTAIQQSVLNAEQHLNNKFAVKLLKALFLVKYVKEFKSTIRNLCILMYDSFDCDITQLKRTIEEALNLLENETYIQRNSETYHYLTDEEQDIEQEIKNVDIESSVLSTELKELLFDGVIKTRKIRWDNNKQDYSFSQKLDDTLFGRDHELSINIITPLHEYSTALDKHRTDTAFLSELRIVLPESDRLIKDLILFKQTEKYIAIETRTLQQDSIKRLLTEKGHQNQERKQQLKQQASELLGKAIYYTSGKQLDLGGEDGQSKVIKAFGELIIHTYPNLKMLRDIAYNENDLSKILDSGPQAKTKLEAQLPEPQQEIFSFVYSNNRAGVRTTLKSLIEKFECKPFGWSFAAILCNVAHLCAGGKIEIRESTNPIDDADLVYVLKNTARHSSLILFPQVEYTPAQLRSVKDFYSEYFEKVVHSTEAKALANELKNELDSQRETLAKLLAQTQTYPFLKALNDIHNQLQELNNKPYGWFITEITANEDQWFDYKEQTIDPIIKFMKGEAKSIYDDAKQLLADQKPNIEYISSNLPSEIKAAIDDNDIYKDNKIQFLKSSCDKLKNTVNALINDEREKAISKVNGLQTKFTQYQEFTKLEEQQQQKLKQTFNQRISGLEGQTLIAKIRDDVRSFADNQYTQNVTQLRNWTEANKQQDKPTNAAVLKPVTSVNGIEEIPEMAEITETSQEDVPAPILAKHLTIDFHKPWLTTEKDIDEYLKEYKKSLVKALKSGKSIQL